MENKHSINPKTRIMLVSILLNLIGIVVTLYVANLKIFATVGTIVIMMDMMSVSRLYQIWKKEKTEEKADKYGIE